MRLDACVPMNGRREQGVRGRPGYNIDGRRQQYREECAQSVSVYYAKKSGRSSTALGVHCVSSERDRLSQVLLLLLTGRERKHPAITHYTSGPSFPVIAHTGLPANAVPRAQRRSCFQQRNRPGRDCVMMISKGKSKIENPK